MGGGQHGFDLGLPRLCPPTHRPPLPSQSVTTALRSRAGYAMVSAWASRIAGYSMLRAGAPGCWVGPKSLREGRPVLQRLEQRLREPIVVGHAGPGIGLGHAPPGTTKRDRVRRGGRAG